MHGQQRAYTWAVLFSLFLHNFLLKSRDCQGTARLWLPPLSTTTLLLPVEFSWRGDTEEEDSTDLVLAGYKQMNQIHVNYVYHKSWLHYNSTRYGSGSAPLVIPDITTLPLPQILLTTLTLAPLLAPTWSANTNSDGSSCHMAVKVHKNQFSHARLGMGHIGWLWVSMCFRMTNTLA